MVVSCRRRAITETPLVSAFAHANAPRFFVAGRQVRTRGPWFNMSLQSLMPVISDSPAHLVEWDFEQAYYGGSSLLVKPGARLALFETAIRLDGDGRKLLVEYAFKPSDTSKEEATSFSLSFLVSESASSSAATQTIPLECGHSSSSELCKLDAIPSDTHSQSTGSGWLIRAFYLSVTRPLVIRAINVSNHSDASSFRLGLLRLIEERETAAKPSLIKAFATTRIHARTSLLEEEKRDDQAGGFYYLNVDLSWPESLASIKYYNVFVNDVATTTTTTSDDVDLQPTFVGSTRIGFFKLLLRLGAEWRAVDQPSARSLSFDVYVQAVDQHLSGHGDSLTANSNKDYSIARVNVTVANIECPNSGDSSFIDKLVCDFDSIEWKKLKKIETV